MSTVKEPFEDRFGQSADAATKAARAIAAYAPRSLSAQVIDFARAVVAQAAARAQALLYAAARLVRFGESVGLAPEPAVLLHPATIERFIARAASGLAPKQRKRRRQAAADPIDAANAPP